jgi:hypothetical protein
MTKRFILAAGAALALAPAAQAQQNESATFAVGGKTFTVTVPAGYCEPQGADKLLSQAIADLDSLNLTHVTLKLCDNPLGDYSIVKSERNAQPVGVPKAMFIALAAKQLETELGQQQLDQGIGSAGEDLASGTGEALTLSSGSAQAAGFDDDCVYITGKAVIAAQGVNTTNHFATCLTLVGGRVFAVHSYSEDLAKAPYDTLKARSRALGASLAVTP